VNDIVITKIIEPDHTVVVLAGEGYIDVEVDYGYIGAEKSTVWSSSASPGPNG
jgi:hypothetical protein